VFTISCIREGFLTKAFFLFALLRCLALAISPSFLAFKKNSAISTLSSLTVAGLTTVRVG